MGKKMMRRCALAASGAMVFGLFGFGGGGCLGGGFRLLGGAVAGGSGFEIGRDLTSTFVLSGITNTQDAVNAVNFNEAVAAEVAARAGN